MKALASLSLFSALVLAACGGAASHSDVAGFPGFNPSLPLTADEVKFSRDMRPVDGALFELVLTKDAASGLYSVSKHTSFVSRQDGSNIDTDTLVAPKMSCEVLSQNVTCIEDDRPVDGDLVTISIALAADGVKYDASMNVQGYDRFHGVEINRTEEIATGLTLQGTL